MFDERSTIGKYMKFFETIVHYKIYVFVCKVTEYEKLLETYYKSEFAYFSFNNKYY